MPRRIATAVLIATVLAIGTAPDARAHAALASSTPGSGEQLTAAPREVVLRFTEQPDLGAGTDVKILNTAGAPAGGRFTSGGDRVLKVPFNGGRGVYTVIWRVLSSVDGHVTAGAFAFGVGESPEGAVIPEPSSDEGPTPAAAVARLILLAGITLMAGAGWVGARTYRGSPPAVTSRAVWIGISLAALGTLWLADAQRSAAQISWSGFRTTGLFDATLQRGVVIAVAAIAVALAGKRRYTASFAGGAALAIFHVLNGHAGSGTGAPFMIAGQAVHAVAAGVWLGGLAVLLAGLPATEPQQRGAAVRSFSTSALIMVVLVLATGVARSLTELGGVDGFDSRYGAYVIAKVVLLLVIVVLGAINRFRQVSKVEQDYGGLRKVGRAEVVLAVGALTVASVMSATTPPRSVDAAEPTSITAGGSDFATTMTARLSAAPGIPGANLFRLTLRSFDGDSPLDAGSVRAVFTYLGAGDEVAPTELDLERTGAGEYEARGANLALPGPWRVGVLATDGTRVRAVDLVLATRSAQAPRQTEVPGQPTLYDIELGSLGRVQCYADPGKPGPNEIHATFFNAEGTEVTGYSDLALTALGPDGTVDRLPVRLLSPGHVVGDVELSAGSWRFDAYARGPAGEFVTGHFEQEVR